jgi:hypothetical protein
MTENSIILSKLIKQQRTNIKLDKKLSFNDLNRISYNLPCDIFSDDCCIWSGYVTNLKSKNKNCYISFFFKNKKVSLHRLLYLNYVEDIEDSEYIKYTCNNKGKCCTLNHMVKVFHEDDDKNKNQEKINEEKISNEEKINESILKKTTVSF